MNTGKEYKIGCSGFYNRHWKGLFYPEKLPQSKWFEHYCSRFNTVEINSTFYKFPTEESLHKWFIKSPADFIFSVKAPKIITHMKKFKDCKRLLDDFYLACENGLEDKLGPVLFQLPPNIHYAESKLDLILSLLKPDHKNVIEFRHSSWWTKKVYDALKQQNITFCSVDHPQLPATFVTTTTTAYVRIHGNPHMFYSDFSRTSQEELYHTISKTRKVKDVFIYFNNTAGDSGVINAQEMQLVCGQGQVFEELASPTLF